MTAQVQQVVQALLLCLSATPFCLGGLSGLPPPGLSGLPWPLPGLPRWLVTPSIQSLKTDNASFPVGPVARRARGWFFPPDRVGPLQLKGATIQHVQFVHTGKCVLNRRAVADRLNV